MPRRTSRSPRASKASWPSSTMLPNLSMWPIASACSGWWSKKSRSDPKRSSSSTRSPCLTTLRILVIYCVHGITMTGMRSLEQVGRIDPSRAQQRAQLPQPRALDLADALPRELDLAADGLERLRLAAGEAEAPAQHLTPILRQGLESQVMFLLRAIPRPLHAPAQAPGGGPALTPKGNGRRPGAGHVTSVGEPEGS